MRAGRRTIRLVDLRRAALERFVAAGFPTQRQEDWKYTNLRRLEARTFAPAAPGALAVGKQRWIDNAGTRIVFVNGHWMPTLSSRRAAAGRHAEHAQAMAEHDPAAVADSCANLARANLGAGRSQPGVLRGRRGPGSRRGRELRTSRSTSCTSGATRQRSVMSNPRVVVRAGAQQSLRVHRALRRHDSRGMLHQRRLRHRGRGRRESRALPDPAGAGAQLPHRARSTSVSSTTAAMLRMTSLSARVLRD